MSAKDSVRKNHIHIAMFLYWLVLVIWQNLSGEEARSTIDTAIKVVLIFSLFAYCMQFKNKINSTSIYIYCVLVASLLVTFVFESERNSLALVTYMYAILMVFIMLLKGGNFKVSVEQYLIFLKCVIFVVLYISIYALINCREQYQTAFSITDAYGNELSSFLTSSHEFGMYLVAGIISAIICLHNFNFSPIKKLLYFACIGLFFVNLILTYSRTSIVAFAVFVAFYLFSSKNDKIKYVLVVVIVALFLVYICVPKLQTFFVQTVFKGGNNKSRNFLFEVGVDYFKNSPFIRKMFGNGINSVRDYFTLTANHGSVHNGYLQVLLYFGIVGLTFMLSFVIMRIVNSYKFRKSDIYYGSIFLSLALSGAMFMLTDTSCVFFSSIDSFFLTVFYFIIPMYLQNYLRTKS